ncbi:MAG: histidine kinase N-terminal 7TM domain-containing protein, partial [Patescibacteria group bacterium]
MNPFAISSILIVVTNVFLGVFVLWKKGDDKLNKLRVIWFLVCLFIVFWGTLGYKISTANSEAEAFSWWHWFYIGPIFIPVFFYHFVYHFLQLKSKEKRYKYILFSVYALALFFWQFSLFFPERFAGDLNLFFGHIYTPSFNSANPTIFLFYVSFYWFLLAYAFFLLFKAFKNSTGIIRNQLKYFIFGSILGWFGPHGFWLMYFNVHIYPYTNFLIVIYPFIFTYAILKYQLMDIKLIIKKAFFYSVGVGLVGGFITTITFLSYWFVANIPGFKFW